MSGTLKIGGKTLATHDTSSNKLAFHSDANDTGQLCRAWVNFNGTNNVIRASFNVQSLTDNGGSGRYTINFINDMPDNKYAVAVAAQRNYVTGGDTDILTANIDMSTSNDRLAASSVSVACAYHSINSLGDPIVMTVAIFR